MILRTSGIIGLITLGINLVIILIVFVGGRNIKANRIFSLFVLSVAFWNLCNFLGNSIQDHALSLFWMRMALVGPIFIPYLFILFSLNFPMKRKIGKYSLYLLAIPSIVLLIFSPTSLNVEDVNVSPGGANFRPGFLYIPFIIYFIFYMGLGLYYLYKSYKEVSGPKRTQILYVFWGALIAAGAGITTNAIIPLAGLSRFDPLGPPLSLLFTVSVVYAILRYRLLNVRVILKKGLVYILLLTIVLIIYTVGVFFIQNAFVNFINIESRIITYLALVIIAISFEPLRRLVQKYIDRFFFIDTIDFSAHLDRFQEKTKGIIQLESLNKKVIEEIQKTIPSENVRLLVKDKKEGIYHEFNSSSEKERRLSFENPLVRLLLKEKNIIIEEELGQIQVRDHLIDIKEVKRLLKTIGACLAAPLVDNNELIGLVILGEKNNKEAFTSEELAYLKSLAPRISYTLSNVLMYHYALLRAMRMADEVVE